MLMEPPVLVAMELKPQDKKGEILDFAKIASAYGKKQSRTQLTPLKSCM